jgi:hypothetical protein
MTARPRRQHERKPGPATLPWRSPDPAPPGDTTATDGAGQDSPSGRLAYSVDEAARLTGLSRDLLYDEMRRGTPDLRQSRPTTPDHPPAPEPVPRHRLLAHSR